MTLHPRHHHHRQTAWLGIPLGAALLVGCTAIPTRPEQSAQSVNRASTEALGVNASPAPAEASDAFQNVPSVAREDETSPAPEASSPQLVKRADLLIILRDLEGALTAVQTTINQAQGDLLSLQDHRSPEGVAQHITLTLRVPQARLDTVLSDLRILGTVQQQSITADDVSDQLIDLEARLKNLRQSEATLLEIMERSGDIADVLEVSRELSTVRESIERMAAQQQTLKQQVVYAHIYLILKSPTAVVAPLRPAGETLGHTWRAATRSVQAFTLGGLKLSVWLLAYSPYLVVGVILAYGGYRRWRPDPTTTTRGNGGSDQGLNSEA
jgi:hypothetical protein